MTVRLGLLEVYERDPFNKLARNTGYEPVNEVVLKLWERDP
jgi:hypothetical protein